MEDMENDAKNFDGQPFNGQTVAEYFGKQGAAIAALARIMKTTITTFEPAGPDEGDGPDWDEGCRD